MDLHQPSPPTPSLEPHQTPPQKNLWDMFRESRYFPIASIIIVAVIVLGLGFAITGLVKRFGREGGLAPVRGPENVAYNVGGEAMLKLDVLRATYRNEYHGSKPLAVGRKFVVVEMEVRNEGTAAARGLNQDDFRLITPDGSIMRAGGWSQNFLNYGIGAGEKKQGEVVFDIDERNAQRPLTEFQIAFGQNPGSRENYSLREE